ncbi:MAG: methyltransferase domain-containing protein [Planctomycetes bacterium]|nr:methyltransferase domain-containing protein [Planctomycetota bacterium]
MDSRELFYESISAEFDGLMNRYELQKRLRLIFEKLLRREELEGKRVLDAGCGTGHFSRAAWERGGHVTALDVGPGLLRRVAEKCDARRVVGSAAALPFADRQFDVVICTEVIEHTSHPRGAVSELVRVLSPGGLLIVTVPCRSWKWSLLVADRLKLRPYHGHENWVGYYELKRWLSSEGLIVEQLFGFNLFPFLFPWTHGLLDRLDRLGRLLGPLMVNIAARGRKA